MLIHTMIKTKRVNCTFSETYGNSYV